MAVDVFDDDDGVIDEDADGEDEGEEGDAVEGVAEEVAGEEGEGEGDGYCDEDDGGLFDAEEEPDEGDDREGREEHVEDELVGFFFCGFAVVAGEGGVDAGDDDAAFHRFDATAQKMGEVGGVGSATFGDGDGDGGLIGKG